MPSLDLSNASVEQISATISTLNEKQDPAWREKLKETIHTLNDYARLEAVGKSLTFEQAKELFDAKMITNKSERWKLSPLFVGMSHDVFGHFIRTADPSLMQIFKEEAVTEPLQHHLTATVHEILHQMPLQSDLLAQIDREIAQLNIGELTRDKLALLLQAIHHSQKFYEDSLEKINKMLALAWNSDRLDLIEKLSQAKEAFQKILYSTIGHPKSVSAPATGFYAKLQEKVFGIFGNPANAEDVDALNDDDPAIEGLAKFSVWYLKDYWKIGLLPSIRDPNTFDKLAGMEGTEEAHHLKAELLSQVKENLHRIGLNTVGDLKKMGIFSQKILQEYIATHHLS